MTFYFHINVLFSNLCGKDINLTEEITIQSLELFMQSGKEFSNNLKKRGRIKAPVTTRGFLKDNFFYVLIKKMVFEKGI